MTKNKQLLLLAAVLITAISVGFFSLSSDGNPTSTIAPNTNSSAINTNNLPDALVGAWTTGATVTTQVYFGGSDSYQRNDTGWVFTVGGNAPSAASGVTQKYNVNTNTYSTLAVLPYTTVVNGCAVLKDSLYTMGGYLSGTSPTANFYKYDINANTWIARASMPGVAAFCKGVGYQDSLIYVARGYDGAAVSGAIYLYNSNTNTWRTATPMPGNRFGGAFSRSGDTLVYVGGADLSLFYNTTYRGVISSSDRSVITWTTGAVCPGVGAGMYRMDLRPWGCKGLVMTGGSTGAAFTLTSNICYTYSPGSDTWTVQANKTTAWNSGQSGSVRLAGNIWKLACVSGYNGTATITNTEIFTDTLCPAPPAGPQTTICRSVNVPLLDHSWARDSVQVLLGSGCVITDVNVRIDTVIHTWDADLSFYLNKGAVSSLIIDNVGGSGDNFIGTVLDDSAATLISAGTAPFTGTFKPSNPLAPFNFGAGLGDGYWRLSISDTATGDTGSLRRWCLVISYTCPTGGIQTIEIPNYYSLSQNYPNPFNPSTSIKFTMPQGDNVKLVIFDILGREVKTLVNEFRNSGTYEVNFDASLLASGVYFYRLEAGEFTDTKRMLLVK